MKISGPLALCLLLLIPLGTQAQILNDTTAYSDTMWRMEKKKLVLDHMELTEAEKACFWPLYDSYTNSIEYIEGQSLMILSEYNESASLLKPKELEKLTMQLMQNDLWLAKLRKQFYRKLSKALSPDHATRFLVLDDTLRQMLRLQIKAGSHINDALHASTK